jgi:hypothetical protein
VLNHARGAVDALVPVDWLAREHVEQVSEIMPRIVEAAHRGQPTPSIVDNLRNVYNWLKEAQAEDNRRPSFRSMLRPRHLAATVGQWVRDDLIGRRAADDA